MNRSQGVTVGAAMMLAIGAFLRSAPQTSAPKSPIGSVVQQVPSSTTSTLSVVKGEGPWIASCQYWSPVRAPETSEKDASANVSIAVRGAGVKLHSQFQASTAKSQCGGSRDPWGIPSMLPDKSTPEITALIAAGPDPERGHLELDFDRTIDSLMQAASDNDYVGSYFWVPWKSADDRKVKSAPDGIDGHGDSHDEPGLIILKYGWTRDYDKSPSFNKVVYLFLVGTTPTEGVSGVQLQKAFEYEAYLLNKSNTTLSIGDRSRSGEQLGAEMDLILFNYSGTAASVRAGVQAVLSDPGNRHPLLSSRTIKTVSISGATSTETVGTLLNDWFGETDFRFHSFAEDTRFEQVQITTLFRDTLSGCDSIAFLGEEGTLFGSIASRDVPLSLDKHCGNSRPLVLTFPRDISLLRNATARERERESEQSDGPFSPYLRFSLGDISTEDSVPHFSNQPSPRHLRCCSRANVARLSVSGHRKHSVSPLKARFGDREMRLVSPAC
jgi:hypothetical protein